VGTTARGCGSRHPEDLADWLRQRGRTDGTGLLLEERVPFVRELAVLVARSPSGAGSGVAGRETVQTDGICTEVLAPAPPSLDGDSLPRRCTPRCASPVQLDVTGVLAVEMFEVVDAGGRRSGSTSSRCVPTTPALVDGRRGHRAVRAAPAGRARPAAGLDPPHERWTVMANVLGGDYAEIYPAYRHVMASDPGRRCTCMARASGPVARSATSTSAATTSPTCAERAAHAADYIQG
jgi:5-(carboxyamino)imidazole ribonucleotide synthase